MKTTIDDTYKALRQTPFSELKALFSVMIGKPEVTRKRFVKAHGWNYKEFYKRYNDSLAAEAWDFYRREVSATARLWNDPKD